MVVVQFPTCAVLSATVCITLYWNIYRVQSCSGRESIFPICAVLFATVCITLSWNTFVCKLFPCDNTNDVTFFRAADETKSVDQESGKYEMLTAKCNLYSSK